jgi:hypothetical protein
LHLESLLNIINVIIDHQVVRPLKAEAVDAQMVINHILVFLVHYRVLEGQLRQRVYIFVSWLNDAQLLQNFLLCVFLFKKVHTILIFELEELLRLLRDKLLAIIEN